MFGYQQPAVLTATGAAPVPKRKGSMVVSWITSTDHKTIGYMYLIASFVFFMLAGVMALLIRVELCGEYHSEMLFRVKVVSESEFQAKMNQLRQDGNTGLLGEEYDRNPSLSESK
jgi:hypothetical protein